MLKISIDSVTWFCAGLDAWVARPERLIADVHEAAACKKKWGNKRANKLLLWRINAGE